MKESWGLLRLNEIPSINTQSIWHAAALTRESFEYKNILFIDWPEKPFVSVGFHQDPRAEVELGYCNEKGYPVYRRACGGGQVFLDGNQIFYHMITDPDNQSLKGNMAHFYSKLLKPVVKTNRKFGLDASYSPVNDIIANNKKISGNGAATLGNSRILTGNFILSFPSKEMSMVLKVPNEKFRDKIIQNLEESVGSYQSILGSLPDRDALITEFITNFEKEMDVKLVPIELPEECKKKLEELNLEYQTEDWKFEINNRSSDLRAVKIKGEVFVSEGMHKAPAGLFKCIVVSENNLIKDLSITGSVSVDPMDGLERIEQALIGASLNEDDLQKRTNSILEKLDMPGVSTADIVGMILRIASSHAEAN